jgi:hypothetical protein
MKVVRISSINDIEDNFGPISAYNELAYMLNAQFGLSGRKVCYGVNVDASEDLTSEYGRALDMLTAVDVYSLATGTTNPGVNALLGPYVDAQSGPYIGQERTAIASYNEEDLLFIGAGDAIYKGSTIEVSGFPLIENGVKKDDDVTFVTSSGKTVFKVIASPITESVVEVEFISGETLTINDTGIASFYVGNPADQSIRIGANRYGNRRITTLFPGWFEATYDGETKMFPPYYIAAGITGLDDGQIESQSLTNLSFAIPGMSNYRLNTNTRFGKLQLDEIGAGGIDIMIQDAPVSQFIKSRHDLTSNMDAIEYRERSITKQVDACAKVHRAAIEPYVGRYNIDDQLLQFIRQIVSVTNDALIKANVVKDISIQSIERDKDIKDKINIILNVTVFVAGNYYDIILNVKS